MIKRNQWLFGAASLLGCGLTAMFFHQRAIGAEHAAAEASRAGQLEANVAQLRRELRAVQDRDILTTLRPAAASPVLSNLALSNGEPAMPVGPASPVSALPPTKVLSAEEMRDRLNVHFYGEATDTSWSQAVRPNLIARLSTALPKGSKLVSMECRTMMCRAEISHLNIEAHREFIRTGFSASVEMWKIATNVSLGEAPSSGKVTSIVFLGRDDQELPYGSDGL